MSEFLKLWTILSPFIAAFLTGIISFYFNVRAKQKEILQQNRISAYREIIKPIIEIEKYCIGRYGRHTGNEFSPFQEIEQRGGITLREDLKEAVLLNKMFLTKKSQKDLQDFDGSLSLLCNAELWMASGPIESEDEDPLPDYSSIYPSIIEEASRLKTNLFNQLGLPK